MHADTLTATAPVASAPPRNNFPMQSGAAAMVVWGFLLRVGAILAFHTYRFHPRQESFAFGYETGRVARAIALGQGFSNPFHGLTGPTAWEAPLYPYLVAGVFKLTGVYTHLSAILILTINSLFSALTAVPVYLIARKVFGPRVAKWCGWTWALLPYTMYWATRWVWETSLTTCLLTTSVWLAMEIADAEGARLRKLWLWFGLLWVVMALTNPSCLTFLPFAGGWACYRLLRQGKPWFVFSMDEGGAEFYQIYRYDLATGEHHLLTDGKSRNMMGPFSNRGDRLAYVSTKRNGRDLDVYSVDPENAASAKMIYQAEGSWFPLDWSPDDSRLLIVKYVSINQSMPFLLDR
jgi:hypothetical protein